MAYAGLGISFADLGEAKRAGENIRKAYELRETVSEREKFYIETAYDTLVSGNLEAARKTNELWAETYPREAEPPGSLGFIYSTLGEHEKAVTAYRDALRLDAARGINYSNLVNEYMMANRLDEARAEKLLMEVGRAG